LAGILPNHNETTVSNTEYHITKKSAKSMTKANVGEAPRSEATQRYPQLFNDETQ